MVNMDYKKYIPYLLGLVAILLSILVPGGPIENRDFSHLSGLTFWGFNAYPIALVVTTLAMNYFTSKKNRWAYVVFYIGIKNVEF